VKHCGTRQKTQKQNTTNNQLRSKTQRHKPCRTTIMAWTRYTPMS